jgi:hypothetical protein
MYANIYKCNSFINRNYEGNTKENRNAECGSADLGASQNIAN